MVPVLALRDPGGVDARQRHNTRTSERKVLRNWEDTALV